MLGIDMEKFDQGTDALTRIAESLERIELLLEAYVLSPAARVQAKANANPGHVRLSSTGSWMDAETPNGTKPKAKR